MKSRTCVLFSLEIADLVSENVPATAVSFRFEPTSRQGAIAAGSSRANLANLDAGEDRLRLSMQT